VSSADTRLSWRPFVSISRQITESRLGFPQPLAKRVAEAFRRSTVLRCAAVTVAVAAYTLFLTWPHVAHLGSTILGPGDNQGGVRALWALHAAGANPFTSARDIFVNAPSGVPLARSINIANFVFVGGLWCLGLIFGFVVGLNVYGLLVFVLSGTAMFLLLDRLRVGLMAAIFGTFVFTFNPNHVERLEGTVPLAATGVLPIVLVLLFKHRSARRGWTACAVGATIALAFYLDSYLGLFALWLGGVLFVVDIALSNGRPRFGIVASYYWSAVTLVLTLIPTAIGLVIDPGSAESLATSRDVSLPGSSGSAQLFLLPGPRNPWLGGPMRSWLKTHLTWEGTMFFGYTTILLAIAGVAIAIVRYRRHTLSVAEKFIVVFAVALTMSSLAASLPPTVTVAHLAIPTPQDVMRHGTTVYRVFARFGVLVGLGLVVLACYALSRFPRRGAFVVVGLLATGLAAVELYVPRPVVTTVANWRTPVTIRQLGASQSGPPHILDVSVIPGYVKELRKLPQGIVANYPTPSAPDGAWAWKDLYYQTVHGHPLWDAQDGTDSDDFGLRDLADNLGSPGMAGILAASDVRYVVVHPSRYRKIGSPIPRLGCGFHLEAAKERSGASIYRVTAPPSKLFLTGGTLLSVYNSKLWPESAGYRWMGSSDVLAIYSRGYDTVNLTGAAVTLGSPRTLTLSGEHGVVGSADIGTSFTKFGFSVPVHPGGNVVEFRSELSAQPRGQGDSRRVSVALSGLQVSSPNAASAGCPN
jgi:hypothetical protein